MKPISFEKNPDLSRAVVATESLNLRRSPQGERAAVLLEGPRNSGFSRTRKAGRRIRM